MTTMQAYNLDVREVVASKMDFVSDGGSFLYLRKGEAHGAIEVAAYAIEILQQHWPSGGSLVDTLAHFGLGSGAVVGGVASLNKAWGIALKQYKLFLDNVDDTREIFKPMRDDKGLKTITDDENSIVSPLPHDMRVICTKDNINVKALPLLLALGARVRHRPDDLLSGSHRYHVNENRFALYYKNIDNRYIGCEGTNAELQAHLKADFLVEWERFGPDVGT